VRRVGKRTTGVLPKLIRGITISDFLMSPAICILTSMSVARLKQSAGRLRKCRRNCAETAPQAVLGLGRRCLGERHLCSLSAAVESKVRPD
jgi:hypothetical protein